jgi:hypothetical protein
MANAFDVIDPRYAPLYDRVLAVVGRDSRIVSVRPSGSVATATTDPWSDLDIEIVTSDEGYEGFLAEWPTWLAAITPTVFARTPIAPFVINALTDEGLTLDLAIYRGAAPVFPPPAYTVGLLAGLRLTEVGAALDYAVNEQLRGMAGPFISLVKREEHVRHLTGVAHLVGLLTTVFVAELQAPPLGKRWNATLNAEQRAAVAALPPVGATGELLIGFGMACAELLVTRARPLFPQYSLEWPAPLAQVVATRVRDQLGIDVSAWLY